MKKLMYITVVLSVSLAQAETNCVDTRLIRTHSIKDRALVTWKTEQNPINLRYHRHPVYDEIALMVDRQEGFFTRVNHIRTNEEGNLLYITPWIKPRDSIRIRGKLLDPKTKTPMQGTIVFNLKKNGKRITQTSAHPSTGVFNLKLPASEQYEAYAISDQKHYSKRQSIDLSNNRRSEMKLSQFLFDQQENSSRASTDTDRYGTNSDSTEEIRNGQLHNTRDLVFTEEGKLQTTVNFEYNQVSIQKQDTALLNKIAGLLMEHPFHNIQLDGHADIRGSQAVNMKISEQRAKTISSYLTKKKVSDQQIQENYFGETKLLDSATTQEAHKKNRRVEMTVQKSEILKVYFGFDKSYISNVFTTLLNNLSDYLQTNKKLKVKIEGYTDNYGPKEYNYKLSEKRAQKVASYLMKKGVDKEQLSIYYHGPKIIDSETTTITTITTKARYHRCVEIQIEKI